MSGWLILANKQLDDKIKIKNFEKTFSIKGVPPLQIKKRILDHNHLILLWTWNHSTVFPDSVIHLKNDKKTAIMIDGVVTGFGKYGDACQNQEDTAKKLLDLWNSDREKILPHLNGSFTFVVFELQKDKMICVTDRIATRSLWYSFENGATYLGNFPAAIACLRKAVHLDGAGLWSLLATSRPVSSRSIFYEIRSLGAGQIAFFIKPHQQEIKNWHVLCYEANKSLSSDELAERIARGLKESAQRIINHSYPVYLFLSGGLDSRLVAGAFGDHIKSLTLTTHANMNSRIAEKVAKTLGIEHRTIIRDSYWYLDTFQAAALISGGNYNLQHAHFIKAVKDITKKNMASFILGDMLENFNKHYFYSRDTNVFSDFEPELLPKMFNKLFSYTYKNFKEIKNLLNKDIAEKCQKSWEYEITSVAKKIQNVSEDTGDRLDTLFRWYNNHFCPTNLMHECIKPFAQVRNLMYDQTMLELLFQLPAKIKTKGRLHPKILKYLNKKLLFIPNSNFLLPPIAPNWMNKMAKTVRPILGHFRRSMNSKNKISPSVKTEGSWHMLHEFYRKDMKYKNYIQEIIFDHMVFPNDVFNLEAIKNVYYHFQKGDLSKIFIIDSLLSFGIIHKYMLACGLKLNC